MNIYLRNLSYSICELGDRNPWAIVGIVLILLPILIGLLTLIAGWAR